MADQVRQALQLKRPNIAVYYRQLRRQLRSEESTAVEQKQWVNSWINSWFNSWVNSWVNSKGRHRIVLSSVIDNTLVLKSFNRTVPNSVITTHLRKIFHCLSSQPLKLGNIDRIREYPLLRIFPI